MVSAFLLITACILLLTSLALTLQSTARAFIYGEGLWSKAQRDAIFYLDRYGRHRNPADFEDFKAALAIPLGDRRARIELQKRNYDRKVVVDGFLAGGNHPRDIRRVIMVMRCCSHISYLKRATEVWSLGDQHIVALGALGERLHGEIQSADASAASIEALRQQAHDIREKLRPLEIKFSQILDEGARWIEHILMAVTASAIVFLLALGSYISWRVFDRIAQSEARYRLLLDTASDALVLIDRDSGKVLESNKRAEQITGLVASDLAGTDYLDLYPLAQRPTAQLAQSDTSNTGMGATRLDIRHHDGRLIPAEVSVSTAQWKGRQVHLAIIRDITQRLQAEEYVRIAANALANIAEGVIITDRDKRILSVNKAFTTITGYSISEVTSRHLKYLQSDRHPAAFYAQVWDTVGETGHWQGEMWSRRRNGEVYPSWTSVGAVLDEEGEITNYVAVFNDISQYKNYEQRLEYLAHHDALTQLPNRISFEGRVREALHRARERKHMIAVLFIDLDGFKSVNDRYGHGAGDDLLVTVAQRIRACVRQGDSVGRMGGDEFTILLDELSELNDAALVAQKLLDVVAQPVTWRGHQLSVFASIGVSCYPRDGEDVQTLLSNADAAMYQAKQETRNAYKLFSPSMKVQASARLDLANALQQAHQRQEFSLVYQPCVDLLTGEFTSLEALIRWNHPERGDIPPATFIPLAEEIGLIRPITEWVLYTACRQATAWRDAGLPPLRMAVNISARHFRDRDLTHSVSTILQATGWQAHWLNLEITEGAVMRTGEEVESMLAELHDMGIAIAVDDFGTGYSSLSYLRNFLIDYLKIDRSFISGIPSDPNDVTIIKSIIAMANNLNIRIIAEGIETEQQLGFLRAEGCHEGQGYLFSRPLPASDVERLLRRNSQRLFSGQTTLRRAAEP